MLSILPFERLSSGSQRDTDRPFKSYSRGAPTSQPLPYSPYSSPFLSSHHKLPPASTDSMDLRAQPHHPYHDMANSSHHQIKQEMDMHYNSFSTNAYHPNYSMPSMNMSSAASSLYSASFSAGSTLPSNGHSMSAGAAGGHTVGAGQTTPTSPTMPSSTTSEDKSASSPGNHSSDSASPPALDLKPSTNSKKRPAPVPEELKDDGYWEKRKKNNESAKRSREARRMKEEQIAMRVVYLEQENLQLRTEVGLLKSEIEKLRCMLYNS